MDVVEFSQNTKREADTLLKQGNVLETLLKHGKVSMAGSYDYDLMYGPDIDIVVLTDDPAKSSTEALKDFVGQRNFRKYQLGDFVKFPMEGRPKGFIVVLINEFEGRKWEIEIWFKESFSEEEKIFEKIVSTATNDQRRTILELKHQREIIGSSKHKLSSAEIYRGVLLDEKTKIEDFLF